MIDLASFNSGIIVAASLVRSRKRNLNDPRNKSFYYHNRELENIARSVEHLSADLANESDTSVPNDVRQLVIAARGILEGGDSLSEDYKDLDKALEAFSTRVPYENEPSDAEVLSVEEHLRKALEVLWERVNEGKPAILKSGDHELIQSALVRSSTTVSSD